MTNYEFKIKTSLLLVSILISLKVLSQTTITIQPDSYAGKDATVRDIDPNINYGNITDLSVIAWTFNGLPIIARSFIDFDFSAIPPGSTITSAILTLYNNPNSSTTDGQHSQLSGSNELYIRRIVTSWSENTVNWNNQPITAYKNEITVPASTSIYQNYIIDVTSIVKDINSSPSNSFGFFIGLKYEQYYRSVVFASSDNSDATLHPKIEITYSNPTGIKDIENFLDGIKIYPNPVSDIITIDNVETSIETKITIFDIHGKKMMNDKFLNKESISIDVKMLPKGLYILEIQNEFGTLSKKVLIQ